MTFEKKHIFVQNINLSDVYYDVLKLISPFSYSCHYGLVKREEDSGIFSSFWVSRCSWLVQAMQA